MPERPEVKTLVEELNSQVAGKTVTGVIFGEKTNRLVTPISKSELEEILINQTMEQAHRKGKYIDLEFSNHYHLVLHLLITGRLSLLQNESCPFPKYFRFALRFQDGSLLCLGDSRGWTKLNVLSDNNLKNFKPFINQGVDIFSDEFTLTRFKELLDSPQMLYPLLLNQHKISGLGNVYVNEVLFHSRIHPKAKANQLNAHQVKKLFEEINRVLKLALKEKGVTIFSFIEKRPSTVGWHTLDGTQGNFWKHVAVFDKDSQPCPNCGTLIKKLKIGSRQAFFCPECQKTSSHSV